jgi:nitrogen fixation protein
MRTIIVLSIFFVATSCISEQSTQDPAQLPAPADTIDIGKKILISSGQFAMAKTIKYNNSKFDLVVNPGSDTVYLSTSDPSFETPEGYKAGMRLSEVNPKDVESMQMETGWGYYLTAASGWQLGFCEGPSCTDSPPTKNSRVNWIFKRNQSY